MSNRYFYLLTRVSFTLKVLTQPTTIFVLQALSWGKEMIGMSGSGPGYMQGIIITPYMHSMIFHVPVMMKMHGSLRQFSGQGTHTSICL